MPPVTLGTYFGSSTDTARSFSQRLLRGRESFTPLGRPRARDPTPELPSREGERSTPSDSRQATLPGGVLIVIDARDFRASCSW